MGRASKCQKHDREAALLHLQKHHPGCPPDVAHTLAARIADREWRSKLTLGHAAGIVITTYVRHHLTDYDHLLRVKGLTRDEARQITASEVQEVLGAWRTGPCIGSLGREPDSSDKNA
jgi:hypothetical protein